MPLSRLPFISLRTRFMALAVLLTFLFSALWGIWTWNRERTLLYERLSQKGEILVSAMAIPIINALLYEELGIVSEGGLLDNFVADIMANELLHPLYAVVLDTDGRVLAHNRYSEYGKLYDDPYTQADLIGAGFRQRKVAYEGQATLDMAIPLAIAGKRWGCLCIGVPLAPLHQELNSLGTQILLFSSGFSLFAIGLFYLVGRGLARPLVDLAGQMEQVNQGALTRFPATARGDEIGLLQENFRQMLERLHQSEVERMASFQRMLENERLATVGKIVSGVAHEVNNPLAGIQGALYHIGQKGDQEIGRYAGLAEQGVERIGKIVNQLLDLSRSARVELENLDSRVLFEDITLFARMALKSKQVFLQATDRCTPMLLRLDRDKIHQVILNLLLNAADAVGSGQTVILEAGVDGHWYYLQVKDQGPGIPADIIDRIFDPFFTTKESGKGSGMGLAISRSIAESHGGLLEVRSDEGSGSAFTLKIPLQPAKRLSHGT
jgi:two-component system, NtrC family, sensor kinase